MKGSLSGTTFGSFVRNTLAVTVLILGLLYFRILGVLPTLPELRSSHQRCDSLPDEAKYNQGHNYGQKGRYTQVMGQWQTYNNCRSYWPKYQADRLLEDLADVSRMEGDFFLTFGSIKVHASSCERWSKAIKYKQMSPTPSPPHRNHSSPPCTSSTLALSADT